MREYLALVYSDGSMGIQSEKTTFENTCEEALYSDRGETDPKHFTKVARVEVKIIEILATPSANQGTPNCPNCGRPNEVNQ